MKSIFFTAAIIIALGLTACGGGNSNKQGTHTHADGTVHKGEIHNESKKNMPAQESFKVEADCTTVKADSVKHDHEHNHSHAGHKHSHDEHDHSHKSHNHKH